MSDENYEEEQDDNARLPQKKLTPEEQDALNKAMQDAIKNGSFT